MSNLRKKLEGKISDKPSGWKKKFNERLEAPWLNEYSAQIAMRILAAIEDHPELTQAELARQLHVTPQQIHKITKGHENLTLETIYKLSKALAVELITFPAYKDSMPLSSQYSTIVEFAGIDPIVIGDSMQEHLAKITEVKWRPETKGTFSGTLKMVG